MNSARFQSVFLLVAALLSLVDAGGDNLPYERAVNAPFIPDTTGQTNQFQVRRAGVEAGAAWKIDIGADGWYRVAQTQLVGAGIAASNLVGSGIRLFNHTQEVAVAVSTDGAWGTNDCFYFYGMRYDGEYSQTNAYWLGMGGIGKRLSWVSGVPPVGGPIISNSTFRVRYAPKVLYRPFHQPLDTGIDHWFAALVNSSADTVVVLNTTNRVNGTALLTSQLYGLSTGSHQTRVRINGGTIGTGRYDNAVYSTTNMAFASGTLTNGMSSLSFRELVAGESCYVMDAVLDYPGRINATGVEYYFAGAVGTNVYRVTGLATQNGMWLLDVTRPYDPVQVRDAEITTNGATYTVRFNYAAAWAPRFLVVQSVGIRTPSAPREVVFRNLANTVRQADYLMICPYELRRQAYRLAKHRYTNGLSVAVAPLPDLYNEFGYGVVDARAIKQFIGYAYHHWTAPRPRYAVLIGEGTDDPLGYIGSVPSLQVPVKSGATPFVVAAEDTWYGLVDGDNLLADVAIGRIPVSSSTQLSNVVNKIISFDNAAIVRNALLVADNDGVNDFAGSSDSQIRDNVVTGGFSYSKVYLPNANARVTIQGTINSGRRLVTYVGHGAMDRWSDSDIWNTNDVFTLNNATYPVVAIFTCNNGSFVDRSANCLAETFIEAPRGASSTFASTALTVPTFSDYVAGGFSRAMAVDARRHLGDVALDAQLNLWNWNANVAELMTYQIIGDPGLIVNAP